MSVKHSQNWIPLEAKVSLWQLSQGHLNCLTACPRQFQQRYLDQLNLPQLPDLEHQTLGAQFHQLMQQRHLGLDIAAILQAEPHLQRWFEAFDHDPPPMIEGDRYSEHQRQLLHQDYLLVAVYDLLILGQDQVQILDWKTYARPPKLRKLRQSWQTRLYRYLLCETSPYAPEQMTMTYWFAAAPEAPASHWVTFPYTPEAHEQTRQELTLLLDQLNRWLTDYQQGHNFPPAAVATEHDYPPPTPCLEAHRQRQFQGSVEGGITDDWVEIEAIAEIPI